MWISAAAPSVSWPATVQSGEVDRGGGRTLRWLEVGDPRGLPIVLVAGAGENALTWAPNLGQLVTRGRTVAYDKAGLGASDPMRQLTWESAVDDLAAVLDVTGPALVVGHSWGGLLAQLAAFFHADA